jgi:hypothetical protein
LRGTLGLLGAAWLASACAGLRPAVPPPAPRPEPLAQELEVTATAYNSLPDQTQGDPHLTASGERLHPGLRALAARSTSTWASTRRARSSSASGRCASAGAPRAEASAA